MTSYVVLEQTVAEDGGTLFSQIGQCDAHSPGHALRLTVVGAGSYVAVPARMFKTARVTTETQVCVIVKY